MPRTVLASSLFLAALALLLVSGFLTLNVLFVPADVMRWAGGALAAVAAGGLVHGRLGGVALGRFALGAFATVAGFFAFLFAVGIFQGPTNLLSAMVLAISATLTAGLAFLVVRLGHSDVHDWALERTLAAVPD